jgi:hypothetical protein
VDAVRLSNPVAKAFRFDLLSTAKHLKPRHFVEEIHAGIEDNCPFGIGRFAS